MPGQAFMTLFEKRFNGRQRVYIEHNGCSRRALDARKFENYFRANGLLVTKNPRWADHILFVSCAFRKIEEDHAIKRIQALSRYRAKLIVAGCLKGINEKRLRENFQGFAFASSNNENIDMLFPDFKIKFQDMPDCNVLYPRDKLQSISQYFFAIRPDFSYFRRLKVCLERRVSRRARYLRIASGCTGEHCRYCMIWRALGELKSKPPDDCVREFRDMLTQGCKKVILVADNLGIYGLDIKMTLPDLLKRLLEIGGNCHIDLEEFHPFWLIKYLDEVVPLLRQGKIKSVLCPIQSANDRILKLMNRRHDRPQLKEALRKIREAAPRLKLYTTIIIGFPSETESEFEETLAFLREGAFELVYIFGYSKNPYLTDPDLISREIPQEVIGARINKAIRFCKRHRIACATA